MLAYNYLHDSKEKLAKHLIADHMIMSNQICKCLDILKFVQSPPKSYRKHWCLGMGVGRRLVATQVHKIMYVYILYVMKERIAHRLPYAL